MTAHGYGAYTHGCRCEVCRKAKADYQRSLRREARQRAAKVTVPLNGRSKSWIGAGRAFMPGVKHGSAASYIEAGCRCQPCTQAATAKRTAEARRRAARRVGAA